MSCKTPRWKHLKSLLQNLTPETFWQEFEQLPGARILDVRTPRELEAGILPNAIHIDFLGDHFWEQLDALDKEATYFVYCSTGRRSVRVATYMRNGGFKHVFNLDGGLGDSLLQKMKPPSEENSL
jgi:rhodanese-related sulfurtransferase